MNSGKKTEVDSGNTVSGDEISDAELDKVTGGDKGLSVPNMVAKAMTGFTIGGNATIYNQAGQASGVAGGATKGGTETPQPE